MKSALIFAIIFICISAVLSIMCYDCESHTDPRCNQYFEPEGIKQTLCDDADMPAHLQKYERRIKATGCLTKAYKGIDGFRFYVRRSCYFGDTENTDETCEAPDPYIPWVDLLSCHVCTDDLCNGGDSFSAAQHTVGVWSKLKLCAIFLTTITLRYIF
ncbi:UPAR/Ly6 domain-containing protein bero-like [Eurosta solidaginis]|uniref:UPAR/Ly6 domain-containing protein bero-like n=1 Tax=Eurosta solidaginis TaxID=178769 RepID=UPI003530937B